jgi:2-oxoisovalerate dehydrogenase E1 component alpha subunit
MPYTDHTLRLLAPEGNLVHNDHNEVYHEAIAHLTEAELQEFYRVMTVVRRFDVEAGNLQRQGQMALWVPSIGQEGAQVGSAFATRPQDHIFPAYREHSVAYIRGLDLVNIIRMLRGITHGGWDPKETNNFHLYTLVIGSHTLHATGYAMGIGFDGACSTGKPEQDEAVLVYFGDGATSQGDTNEAMIFAQSYQTPQVFFLQNNHWAISVPVRVQSRTPLFERAAGFGLPSIQIDGNDVLMSYAATRLAMDEARSGSGPQFIEALTYRIGAHTTSDDPTKYRDEDELAFWQANDPIDRFRAYLVNLGIDQSFFDGVAVEAEDYAADIRKRTLEIVDPVASDIFSHVFTGDHAVVRDQAAWLDEYLGTFEEGQA